MSKHIYNEEWFAEGLRNRKRLLAMPTDINVPLLDNEEMHQIQDALLQNHEIDFPKETIPSCAKMLRSALLSDTISLSSAVAELNNLAFQMNFEDVEDWTEDEILWYSQKYPESLPDYRIFDCQTIVLGGIIDGRECRGGCFERDMLPQEVLDVTGTIKFWNSLIDVERGIAGGGLLEQLMANECRDEIYKKTDAVFKCDYVLQLIYHEQLVAIADAVRERALQDLDIIANMQVW